MRAGRLATSVIAAGIAVLIIGIATGRGLQIAISDKISTLQGDAQIRSYHQPSAFESTPFNVTTLDSSDMPASFEAIESGWKAAILTHDGHMEGLHLSGYAPWPNWLSDHLVAGHIDSATSLPYPFFLSQEMARRLQIEVGDELSLYFQREGRDRPTMRYVNIVGIFETGFSEWDAEWGITSMDAFRKMLRWDSTEVGAVQLTGLGSLNETQISDLRQSLPLELDVYRPQQDHAQIYQWLVLFDTNTWVLIAILIAVAIFNSAVVIYVLVLSRYRHIAILKTLGLSSGRLNWAFFGQLARYVTVGMIWGNLIGMAVIGVQDATHWLQLNPETYYISYVPIAWPIARFIGVNLLVFSTVTLTAWLPARLLSKIRPAEVLRM